MTTTTDDIAINCDGNGAVDLDFGASHRRRSCWGEYISQIHDLWVMWNEEAALRQGVDFPYSCRVGGCATCKCRLLDGKVKELLDRKDETVSAVLLGKDDEAAFHMKRYRIAYPADHARWLASESARAAARVFGRGVGEPAASRYHACLYLSIDKAG